MALPRIYTNNSTRRMNPNHNPNHHHTQNGLLTSLSSDIVIYELLALLDDGDAMSYLETCKQLFYSYVPHYRMKSIIPLLRLYQTKPVFRKDVSNIPRPIIVRGWIDNSDELEEIDELLEGERSAGRKDVDADKINEARKIIARAIFPYDLPSKVREDVRKLFGISESEDESYDSPTAALGYDFRRLARKEFYSLEELHVNDETANLVYGTLYPANLKRLHHSSEHWFDGFAPGMLKAPLEFIHIAVGQIYFTIFPNSFPNTLKVLKLDLEISVKKWSSEMFPTSVEELTIYDIEDENKDLLKPECLPPNLKKLDLNREHIEREVSMKGCFRTFPSTLVSLILTNCIFEPGILPSTLQSLHVHFIDKVIIPKNVLPSNLISFTLPSNLSKEKKICEDGALPISLQTLKIPEEFDKSYDPVLTELFASLPHLTKVEIDILWLNNNINENTFPASVRCLEVGRVENINEAGLWKLMIDEIEITLTCFGGGEESPLGVNIFPPSLKVLTFPDYQQVFLQPGSLPSSLEKLTLKYYLDLSIAKDVLPPSLKTLTLCGLYGDGKIEELPQGLQYLYLDVDLGDEPPTFRIDKSIVPPGLQIQPLSPAPFAFRQEVFYLSSEEEEKEEQDKEGQGKEQEDITDIDHNSSRKRKRSIEEEEGEECEEDENNVEEDNANQQRN